MDIIPRSRKHCWKRLRVNTVKLVKMHDAEDQEPWKQNHELRAKVPVVETKLVMTTVKAARRATPRWCRCVAAVVTLRGRVYLVGTKLHAAGRKMRTRRGKSFSRSKRTMKEGDNHGRETLMTRRSWTPMTVKQDPRGESTMAASAATVGS